MLKCQLGIWSLVGLLSGCLVIPIPDGVIGVPGKTVTQLPDNRVVEVSTRPVNGEEVERVILELTNQERISRGLSPLQSDKRLSDVARNHSQDMLNRRFFSHTNPDGKSVRDRVENAYPGIFQSGVGENIYQFVSYDGSDANIAANLVKGWMDSPGHRENILKPEYVALGVGVFQQSSDLYATQVFSLSSGK